MKARRARAIAREQEQEQWAWYGRDRSSAGEGDDEADWSPPECPGCGARISLEEVNENSCGACGHNFEASSSGVSRVRQAAIAEDAPAAGPEEPAGDSGSDSEGEYVRHRASQVCPCCNKKEAAFPPTVCKDCKHMPCSECIQGARGILLYVESNFLCGHR